MFFAFLVSPFINELHSEEINFRNHNSNKNDWQEIHPKEFRPRQHNAEIQQVSIYALLTEEITISRGENARQDHYY